MSERAQQRFADLVRGRSPPDMDIVNLRKHYADFNQARLDVALALFEVDVQPASIGGVEVYHVTQRGIDPSEPRRLICLHGGAFMWGAGAGALLEAVPIAATAGVPVIAVEYRLAPEHRFPAATEDVIAVFEELLTQHDAASIGIYGCSAGATLTAQSVARLVHDDGAVPGAVAMLHATGLELGGDSLALNALLNGMPNQADGHTMRLASLPYLSAADPADPLVFPGNHPETLARFPPSLLVSGTRDFAASAISVMHRRLQAAGAKSDLILFDGMWHAHHVDTDLDEAQETFRLVARFFDEHLKR